jgi:hypothetical protein
MYYMPRPLSFSLSYFPQWQTSTSSESEIALPELLHSLTDVKDLYRAIYHHVSPSRTPQGKNDRSHCFARCITAAACGSDAVMHFIDSSESEPLSAETRNSEKLSVVFGYYLHSMTGDPLTPQTTWSQYAAEVYLTGKRPINGSYDHRVVEARAREATKDNHCACTPYFASHKLMMKSRH